MKKKYTLLALLLFAALLCGCNKQVQEPKPKEEIPVVEVKPQKEEKPPVD